MKINSLITGMAFLFSALPAYASPVESKSVGPIIDVHLHAGPGRENSSLFQRALDDTSLRWFQSELDRHNVTPGLVSGPASDALRFQQAAPGVCGQVPYSRA
ncbi:hypothetical protein [Microbulbifer aggregans]|uniref:hypothetical protein n=1 Tax=Microbulbifer aggregans TaxID=1769779 RepID=UPI001CFEE982|nr:hypothetical protein [Microbulbifer aggregans]